ncbi:HNH endonuclease [Mycobacterium sp. E802]|uniref:HNH endonuclease n=1 Tax=Mycobacterium sp. E802 TaxID=1834152 RepID=UPI000AB464BD|nr:HNH endonuclease [Mycobacterium sp. E802]
MTGAENLQFNDAGKFFRSRHLVTLTGKYGHLIDLGKNYGGPVPTAYGGPVTGGYLADPDDAENEQLEYNRLRRASEVIAYEVFGSPPDGWVGAWVKHLDSDPTNLAPHNLEWATTVNLNDKRHNMIKGRMVSDVVRSQRANNPSRGGIYRPRQPKHAAPFMDERLDVPLRPRIMHHQATRRTANK